MDDGPQQLPSQSQSDPDVVLAKRDGKVLLKATLLKSDHFPGTDLRTGLKQLGTWSSKRPYACYC